MIDMKDSRIRLCTTYEEDGKKKAVIHIQLTPKKHRVYILTVFHDKRSQEVIRLRCNWHENDGAHKIDYRIPRKDFIKE